MLAAILSGVGAILALVNLSAAAEEAAYRFEVDGKPRDLWVRPVFGETDEPAPGDLIYVGSIPQVLGEPGVYRFETTPEEDGRLFRLDPDGKKTVTGAAVEWTYEDDKVVFNPLKKLSPGQLRALRGVHLDTWEPGLEKFLAQLNGKSVAISISEGAGGNGHRTLPPLPADLRYLIIDAPSSNDMDLIDELAKLKKLAYLEIDARDVNPLDFSLITASESLRVLKIDGYGEMKNLDHLGSLKGLRELDLAFCDTITNGAFLAGLTSLRQLDIRRTSITDLSPIGSLTKLQRVRASGSPISILPAQPTLPALRELDLQSTGLDDKAVAALQAKLPACEIKHRWEAALRKALEGADHLRVRSGGTCHRRIKEERTLFEVNGAEAVSKVINHIAIAEEHSGGHCMCCGEPSFEFMKDGKIVLTLGFHHGQGVRWPEGWPGDAAITPESAERLCLWLDQNGVKGPLAELEESRRAEAAMRRLWDRYGEILSPAMMQKVEAARSAEDLVKAFHEEYPNATDRAESLFRLHGARPGGNWSLSAGFDRVLHDTLLPAIAKEEVTTLAKLSTKPEQNLLREGIARWWFFEEKIEKMDDEVLKETLPAIASWGLAHPRQENRRATILALRDLGADMSAAVLAQHLAEPVPSRPLRPGDENEPGGMTTFRPQDGDLPTEASDRAWIALVLAQFKHQPSRNQISALAKASDPGSANGKAYATALEKFE